MTAPAPAPTKLPKATSFMDAINERYGAEDDSNAYADTAFDVGATRSAKKNNKKWEMVGMEAARQKQSNHSRLSVLGLQNCNISFAEKSDGQIASAGLKRVRELNLSDNDGLTAADIDKIVSALPSLVELQLSGTGVGNVSCWSPLASQQDLTKSNNDNIASSSAASLDEKAITSPLSDIAAATTGSSGSAFASGSHSMIRPSSPFVHTHWARLTTLALNRCNMSWDNLIEAFPCNLVSLTSLHLESNGIVKIYPPQIRRTPSQQHAALVNNTNNNSEPSATTTATAPDEKEKTFLPMFPALKELNLSFNELTTLDQDPEMIKFLEHDTPKLTSLNLTGNKITISRSEDNNNSNSANYLSRLEVLYLPQNPSIVSANYSSVVVEDSEGKRIVEEEPLSALEWLRVTCPKVKSLRITYSDVFGLSAVSIAAASKENTITSDLIRAKSSLSEVQQRALVIAALPQIETLNSGPVRAKERLDAEMLYLQVARAKKEQQQQQSQQHAASATSATNRFFPWKSFPLLDNLAEKHKNVILTSLNNSDKTGAGANGLAAGSALAYTLKLTFHVLSEQTKEVGEGDKVIRTNVKIPMAEGCTKNVPGNMTVGKLKSFIASIFPTVASVAQQKKVIAFAEDNAGSTDSAVLLAAVDDENPLILCGVPSNAVIEVFV